MRSVRILVAGVTLLTLLAAAWLLWGKEPGAPSARTDAAAPSLLRSVDASALTPEDESGPERGPVRREVEVATALPSGPIAEPLRVVVVHAETRAPVPGAELVTWPESIDGVSWPETESTGETLRRIGETVRADAEGRAEIAVFPERAEVYAFAEGLYGRQEFLPPFADEVTVVVAPDFTVAGRVVDTLGRGVADLAVEVFPEHGLALDTEDLPSSHWGHTDGEGNFRIPHLQQNIPRWEVDAQGRPRLGWSVQYFDAHRSGVVDWARPLRIEVPAAGHLHFEALHARDRSLMPEFSVRILTSEEESVGHWSLGNGRSGFSAELPLGQRFVVWVQDEHDRRSPRRIRVPPLGPVDPSDPVRRQVEIPWEFTCLRGRILDPSGVPIADAQLMFEAGDRVVAPGARTDEFGRVQQSWWLEDEEEPLTLTRVHVRPKGCAAIVLDLERELVPGLVDLGDLTVEPVELSLRGTIRVEGLEPGDPPLECRVLADGRTVHGGFVPAVEVERVRRGLFEVRGDFSSGPIFFAVSGVLLFGRCSLDPGESSCEVQIQRLGALDLEVLAPWGLGWEGRLVGTLRRSDGRDVELELEPVAPGTLRGRCVLPPADASLVLSDGDRIVHRIENLVVEAGRRLSLTGERAVDLRDAYRDVVLEFVDPTGRPLACSGEWCAWGDQVDGTQMHWFEGPRVELGLRKEDRTLVLVPEDARPALVPVTGRVQRVVVARMQPTAIDARVGELPDGIECLLRIEILGDELGIPIDDPRREELNINLSNRVSEEEGPEYEDWYYPGTTLDVRVLLQSERDGKRMRSEVARQRVEVALGKEQHVISVDVQRVRDAVEALGR